MKKLAFVLSLAVVFAAACEKGKLAGIEEETPKGQAPLGETVSLSGSINVATIAVHTADGKAVNFSAEIAATDEERMRGLMGRESLPRNYGMWFVFPSEVQDAFWMKDTFVNLDLIFVGSDMKIVDIIQNAEARSERLLEPKASYRYVLEIGSGAVVAGNIAVGDHVEQRIGPAK